MTRVSFYDSVYSCLESTKVRKPRDRVSCSWMSCVNVVFLILMKASLLRSFHFAWRCFNGILANGVMSPPCKINRKCRRLCPWRGLMRKLIFVTKFSYNWVVRTYILMAVACFRGATLLRALTFVAPSENILKPSDSSNLHQFVSIIIYGAN